MKIINPYAGVNFATDKRIRSVSHEHIYQREQAERCYNRGIRVFANVNYTPAVPSVNRTQKMSAWDMVYKDWADVYTDAELLAAGVIDATGKPDFSKSEYFADLHYQGAIPFISDYYGTDINTDLIPQLANAEHTDKPLVWGNTSYVQHHNVLGGIWNDAGVLSLVGVNQVADSTFRRSHPLYSVAEEVAFWENSNYHQFAGKVFGTLNHNSSTEGLLLFRNFPVFKAVELFNQGFSPAMQERFRKAYDGALRTGWRLNVAAVADWQQSIETYAGLTHEEKAQYTDVNDYNQQVMDGIVVKECNYIRGCNVLLLGNDYGGELGTDSVDATRKAEAAIDAYISGQYYASGFGNHKITALTAENGYVEISVAAVDLADAAPKILVTLTEPEPNVWRLIFTPEAASTPSAVVEKAKVITNLGVKEISGAANVRHIIQPGETYVRFEFYFADKDFIFTNPIWIEGNDYSGELDALILGVI